MAEQAEAPLDRLWSEYGSIFHDFDDLMLARWMAQTLSQLQGRIWRLSHPLVGAFRLAAQVGHERQIWLKRLVSMPPSYVPAHCCRAPLLPLLTRDVLESGLICLHCNSTGVPLDDIPPDLLPKILQWAQRYGPVHAVAHQEESQRPPLAEYDRAFEEAARSAEQLLSEAGKELMPGFLDHYSASIWEDQDECLEVRPEDVLI